MNRLKRCRMEKGLSQAELARRLNANRSVINAYETGERIMSKKYAEKIASVLKVDEAYLMGSDSIKVKLSDADFGDTLESLVMTYMPNFSESAKEDKVSDPDDIELWSLCHDICSFRKGLSATDYIAIRALIRGYIKDNPSVSEKECEAEFGKKIHG